MNGPAIAGLLTVFHSALDIKGTLLDQFTYLFYFLSTAMYPRVLSTVAVSEETGQLEPIKASVRVGLAVETVGQAGRPKTITGFQTHSTPVLLGVKDRAELANRDFVTVTSILEGVVIVEKAPAVPEGNTNN
jgi:26S proteasome regulatory subunit N1